jgi:hypothetical protein
MTTQMLETDTPTMDVARRMIDMHVAMYLDGEGMTFAEAML